jgi:hypothetical protein
VIVNGSCKGLVSWKRSTSAGKLDAEHPALAKSFRLQGRVPYVVAGERFYAFVSIIAGVPPRRINLGAYSNKVYDPLGDISAPNAVDRCAAVKSLPYLPDKKKQAISAIEVRIDVEPEDRVLLEGSGRGNGAGISQGMGTSGRICLSSGQTCGWKRYSS